MKNLLISILMCISAQAIAEGNGVGGGGKAKDGVMVDLEMVRGKFDIKKDKAYSRVYEPIMNMLDQCVPSFRQDGGTRTYEIDTTWYKVGSLKRLQGKDENPIEADQIAINRVQNVYVDKKEFQKANIENRGILYLHELFQFWRLVLNKNDNPNSGYEFRQIREKIPADNVEALTARVYDSYLKWLRLGKKRDESLCYNIKSDLNTYLNKAELATWISRADEEKVQKTFLDLRENAIAKCETGESGEYKMVGADPAAFELRRHRVKVFENLFADLINADRHYTLANYNADFFYVSLNKKTCGVLLKTKQEEKNKSETEVTKPI